MRVIPAASLKLFRSSSMFQGLSDEEILTLVGVATEKFYPAGTVLFQPGDSGTVVHIVVEGSVDIYLPNRPAAVARISEGKLFGELGFLDGKPRTAEARCVEPTILLSLARVGFDAVLTPRMGMVVMHNIALDLSAKLRGATLCL